MFFCRYGVVTFGGRAPFDKPRSIYYGDKEFTSDFNELEKYFQHIDTMGGRNNDILQAISMATRLNFRPGVSKTFILLSCNDCNPKYMRFDYASILQYMLEEGVNLYILADTEFDFERTRKLRHFYGLDRELVYSKRYPEGDAETRRQIYISKTNLGICTPLALETGGAVFSARKLRSERKYSARKFVNIFAKRIVTGSQFLTNQTCECTGQNTGSISYMACTPNINPTENINLDDYVSLQF